MPRRTVKTPEAEDLLLLPREVSKYRNAFPSENTLARWRRLGIGPRWAKMGRVVKYRQSDLDAYIEQCTRSTRAPLAA